MSRAAIREKWLTVEVLRSAQQSHGGWQPWKGVYQRAKDLADKGFLKVAGSTAMPPHVCYVISPAGECYLRMHEAETNRALQRS